ncbi:MAG: DNA-directed RNA polymerase subunit K [Promethearchaeati archaeon SRVP18_Atabeyarchaeia-1]
MRSQGKESEEDSSAPANVASKGNSGIEAFAEKIELPTALNLPLTKYERSRIIGSRALQISLGAPILVEAPPNAADPITIAEIELKANVLPITIRRKLPGGRQENIPLSKLPMDWL